MKAGSLLLNNNTWISNANNGNINADNCQLVLGFGGKEMLSDKNAFETVRKKFPAAQIALCTTAGEIFGIEVYDNSLSLIAFEFEHSSIKTISININDFENSYDAGANLVKQLPGEGLRYIFVLSDGGMVNGSQLVRGIESVINHTIPVTGGLAGDGANFVSTLVGLNEQPATGNIVAIGFYGDRLKISHGSMGGWDVFGMERTITKSVDNKLYEIDGKNALALYKEYLGKYADELPVSALLFPLSVQLKESSEPVVRTILSIDNTDQSMVFAGDVPQGSKTRFMKANFDKLIDAAIIAAQSSINETKSDSQKVAILISCVGRKLILGKRVDEEVEAVSDTLGSEVLLSGFYSYGEISPLNKNTKCELHNQTMTITTFEEK